MLVPDAATQKDTSGTKEGNSHWKESRCTRQTETYILLSHNLTPGLWKYGKPQQLLPNNQFILSSSPVKKSPTSHDTQERVSLSTSHTSLKLLGVMTLFCSIRLKVSCNNRCSHLQFWCWEGRDRKNKNLQSSSTNNFKATQEYTYKPPNQKMNRSI